MAEGIESYDHVPQQSRRDKLREHQSSAAVDRSNFFPFYDPSSLNNNNPLFFNPHPFFDPQIQPNSNDLLLTAYDAAAAAASLKPAPPLSLSLSSQPYNLANVVPLGPFTGYASVLKGSTFLKPAQQLLEDLCQAIHSSSSSNDSGLVQPSSSSSSDSLTQSGIVDHHHHHHQLPSAADVANKSTLVSMLDEVYRRYKQYYQQIQEVMTSFEYISGLGNAAPYANQAIKVMYKHFKCLKNAILDQLQFNKKTTTTHGDYSQRSIQNTGYLDHQPVWRPQRGLPERAVTVLRAWLFEHFLHPYPSDTDKLMLAKQTGLSRSQVSNWFINARVRLWKPMVEEIYMLETKQTQKSLHRDDRNAIRANDHQLAMDNPSTSAQQIQNTPKRTRNELHHDMPMTHQDEQMKVSYNNLSTHPHVVANANMAAGGNNNGGVSLTLGLHQNHGIGGFSEPFPVGFPVAATRRFGLGIQANNDGYVMGGHFGRDVLGGQMLHDFVG